jgi:hypothetical protein
MILNFKTSETRVSNFQNVSITNTPLGFAVKSYQNFQNTLMFIFLKKKNYKNFQKDSSMSIFANFVKL